MNLIFQRLHQCDTALIDYVKDVYHSSLIHPTVFASSTWFCKTNEINAEIMAYTALTKV